MFLFHFFDFLNRLYFEAAHLMILPSFWVLAIIWAYSSFNSLFELSERKKLNNFFNFFQVWRNSICFKSFVVNSIISHFETKCFIAFLRKNFRLCCSMSANFSRKNLSKIRYIFENFLKKSMFYASKRFQMERFCKILMKSPMTLHAARFKKISEIFEKFSFFDPQNPQKFTFYTYQSLSWRFP